MFYYIVGTPILVTFAQRAKVKLDLWNLFKTIVSFGFYIFSENNVFGFNSFKKFNFSKMFPLYCTMKQV